MTWPIKIGGTVLVVLILALAVMFVGGLGPFKHGPSAAAKAQPKVAAAVTKTGAAETAAVGKAEEKTKAAAQAAENRIQPHVAKVRAIPRPAPVEFPDRDFYVGVCSSVIYEGDPDCSGFRGEPESGGPAARKGALQRR